MRGLTFLKSWFSDWLDSERPNRLGARLRPDKRCYGDELGDWPQAYRMAPGHFHIRAAHYGPSGNLLDMLGLGFIGAASLAICWTFAHVHPVAALGLALLLSPVLLCYHLGKDRLEIIIRPDGWVLKREMGGGQSRFVNFRRQHLVLHVHAHSDAPDAAATAATVAQAAQAWQSRRASRAGQGGGMPPSILQFGPTANAYAEATELSLASGPAYQRWVRVAEFAAGRDGYELKAAIEFLVSQVDRELAPHRVEAADDD